MPESTRYVDKILDFYLAKLPPEPKAFYLRPREKCPLEDEAAWYINVPVGINTLQSILPNMSAKAGTSVRYTNHSLRATSATRLFASGIPEKVIQDKTGHHSLAGLRAYERTSVEQEHAATRVVTSDLSAEDKENADAEQDEKPEVQSAEKDKKRGVAVFSGQLQNCVINLYRDSK